MNNVLTSRLAIICALTLGATAVSAQSTTNLVVTPEDFVGINAVGVTDDAAPGYASGSFASNGIAKSDMYFTPDALFKRPVALGDIARMSYWTKTEATHAAVPADWYLAIYTSPYEGDCSSGSWYGDRIGTEPYFSKNINDPADTWNNWSTDGAENQLRFFESTGGCNGATFGSYTDPDWATFVGGNGLSGDALAGHGVLYISVQTGSAWAAGFEGQLDGFEIELTDGSIATVNFEKVKPPVPPIPTMGNIGLVTLAAFMLLGGLLGIRRFS